MTVSPCESKFILTFVLNTFNSLIELLDNNKKLLNYYYEWAKDDIMLIASVVNGIEEKR